jgi:hypothetical protein
MGYGGWQRRLQVLEAAGSGHENTVAHDRGCFLKKVDDKIYTFAMTCTSLLLP